MLTEARKIHVIEEVLKVSSNDVLAKLESVLKITGLVEKKHSARDFSGTISKKDIDLMTLAIEQGCEQVNADDWK